MTGPDLERVLHPESRALLDAFARDGVPGYDQLSVLAARRMVAGASRLQGERIPVAQVSDVLVTGAAGRLPARIYRPEPARSAPGTLVYFHGGGFVTGTVDVADRPCRGLAVASGWTVVSVEYRLAPENPFPAPLDDCSAAIRWVAAEFPGQRLVVAGDSAGGNLATAAARSLRHEIPLAGQLLLYPTLAPPADNESMRRNGQGFAMSRASLEWFWDHYLARPDDRTNPRAAPLLEPDLAGMPPTTIVLAQFDPLRDEGMAYADRLIAAGIETTVHEVAGALHGFWWYGGTLAADLTDYLAGVLTRLGGTPVG